MRTRRRSHDSDHPADTRIGVRDRGRFRGDSAASAFRLASGGAVDTEHSARRRARLGDGVGDANGC